MFDPPLAKKKAGLPPLPIFSIIPIACPCTKGKALQRKQNLLPREKLRNVRSLPVIQSSPIPRGLKVPNRAEENLQRRMCDTPIWLKKIVPNRYEMKSRN